MSFLIGLVGERGAGKSTVVRNLISILADQSITTVSIKSSDLLGDALDIWGVPRTTENLQLMGRAMRDNFGDEAIPNAMDLRISESAAQVVIWDGIRWLPDERLVRRKNPSSIIYVTAPMEERFLRISKRTEKAEEISGSRVTLSEFQKIESESNEAFVPEIGSRADFVIQNAGNEQELNQSARNILAAMEIANNLHG